MGKEHIFYQYQKYIAMTEKMHLNALPTREPVLAGAGDLLPSPQELLEPLPAEKKDTWRPINVQEVVMKMREARN